MRVTRFQYPLEKTLVQKLDLMIERCITKKSKKDTLLILDGAEGEGKTTLSIAIGYYVSEKTGRDFGHKNVFFDLNKMIEFAKSTKEQIIIWDEPALQALSTDWNKGVVKNLQRVLMMARKKRHFIMVNMTKFYKFNEYIVVDRSMGLIHIYSRRNVESGRFIYIRKKMLEPLWRDYRFGKKRSYFKYADKIVKGTFPDILNPRYKYNVLSEFDVKAYEKNKDDAINSIGVEEKIDTPRIIKREVIYTFLRNAPTIDLKLKQKDMAKLFGIGQRTIELYIHNLKKEKKSATRTSAEYIDNGNIPPPQGGQEPIVIGKAPSNATPFTEDQLLN